MRRLLFTLMMLMGGFYSHAQEKFLWLDAEDLKEEGFFYNHGMTREPKAVGLIFKNSSDQEKHQMVRLNNAHINRIFVYSTADDTLYRTGDHLHFNTRPVVFPDFIFPVTLKPHSIDSVIFSLDKSGENLRYFIEVKDPASTQSAMNNELLVYGILICFCLIISAMFVIWGILRKNVQHIFFALFIIATASWSLNNMGVFFEFVWPDHPLIQHSFRTIFSGSALGLLLIQIYLYYQSKMNRWTKYFLLFFIVFFLIRMMIAIIMPSLFNDSSLKFNLLVIGSSITLASLLLVSLIILINMRHREMILHNIGYLFYFTYPIREAFLQFGLPLDPFPEHNEAISGLFFLGPLGFIGWGNLQQYRRNRKKKNAYEVEQARLKEIELGRKIVDAQEYERSSIGKNLHDQVGGLLSVMKIKMQMLKKKRPVMEGELEELISIVDAGSSEILNIVDDLIPPEFDRLHLNEILQNRFQIFESATGIVFHLTSTIRELDKNLSLKIYRVICELMTNSVKHASCSEISIDLCEHENKILLRYTDNGKGMDLNRIKLNHGIRNIQSRIQHLGGTTAIKSKPGQTEYKISIPLSFGL